MSTPIENNTTELEKLLAKANALPDAAAADAVLYTPQELTDEQKAQARVNIGIFNTDDIPKVFFGSALPQLKTDTLMKFRYTSAYLDVDCYCVTKAQGNSSMAYPKKNQTVKIYADATCTEKHKLDLRGWGKQNKYCFKANWTDLSHARNVVSARIWGDMVKTRDNYEELPELLKQSPNLGAIDGFPVKVFAAGKYQGRYTLNIPKDKWMTNMDDENPNHCILCGENYGSACFRSSALIDGTDWSDEIHETVPESIKTRWNEVIAFVMNSTDDEFSQNLHSYFDITSLIDYYIFGLVSCNLDGFGKNQLYLTYDGVKWYASVYDMDATWGLDCNSLKFVDINFPRSAYQDMIQSEGNLLYIRLAKIFEAEIKARWEIVRNGALSVENIINRFERFTDIAPETLVAEDYAETTADGAFTAIPLKDSNNIQQIRAYALGRVSYVNGLLLPERANLWNLSNKSGTKIDYKVATDVIPLDYDHYFYPGTRTGIFAGYVGASISVDGNDVAITVTNVNGFGYGILVPVQVEAGKTYKLTGTIGENYGSVAIVYYNEDKIYQTHRPIIGEGAYVIGDFEREFTAEDYAYALIATNAAGTGETSSHVTFTNIKLEEA